MLFADRVDAGRQLAQRLGHLRSDNVVVLGIPRGGVPVAAEVARALDAPLDVVLVRKLGVPFQRELAMGAVGEGGARVLNDDVIEAARVAPDDLAIVEQRERAELQRRVERFRGEAAPLHLAGRVVVIVDDGIATGSTALAACRVARSQGASRVVLAVPVAPPGWEAGFRNDTDECVTLATPEPFYAVGQHYRDFSPTTDDDVVACLRAAHAEHVGVVNQEVEVPSHGLRLPGYLTVPASAKGIVVFAHGSGSSRHSSRNRFVAATLNAGGVATLLFDLLTPEEEIERSNVFDIDLLATRLRDATAWVRQHPGTASLPVGYFGASTGAAAALWAAGAPQAEIAAVVSRGGRPDLAAERLASVRAPTLLIVGGHDAAVLELNRKAQAQLTCDSQLSIVPGASHLFEEPGTLAAAATLALHWFDKHLARFGHRAA